MISTNNILKFPNKVENKKQKYELIRDKVEDLLHSVSIDEKDIWAMPGDSHPNALGHRIMKEQIYPSLMHARRIFRGGDDEISTLRSCTTMVRGKI